MDKNQEYNLQDLILYSTEGCHLCDLAEVVITRALPAGSVRLRHVDIALSEDLMKRYGWSIPVVKRVDVEDELGWPFDEEGFINWLKAGKK